MPHAKEKTDNIDKMNNRLGNISTFLTENRQFNHSWQDRLYLSVMSPYRDKIDKVLLLPYHIAYNKNQQKFDSLAILKRAYFRKKSKVLLIDKRDSSF